MEPFTQQLPHEIAAEYSATGAIGRITFILLHFTLLHSTPLHFIPLHFTSLIHGVPMLTPRYKSQETLVE
jgi:hypothetical protein